MELINVWDYEERARKLLEEAHWDYFAGGSEDEVSLRANLSDFTRLRLRPRMLVDMSSCQLNTTVLGTPVSMPVLVAPTAYHGLAHPDGECATAQGTAAAGTLMVAPTNATRSLEEIASATTGPLWFQLYLYPTREIAAELVKRAEDAGYRALVLTVDRPVRSKRERDLRHDFFMPPPSVVKANFTGTTGETHLALTWQDVTWLRDLTSLPVLVKGVLTAEDALLALAHGAAGIIVSNHGGRQLDGTVTALEALPEIVAAISGRCEVYMDGGIRRGTDILKALALGAQAVLVGRPALWGLAVDGAQGVERVLNILRDELLMAMQLAGCPTLADITPSLVRWH